ncbi:MAG: hypothetical protein CVU65_12815 [Deltaproteobacteria bacterium HGW-Deltaproteobacteria-22]|jgi:hypothetical protein|nr:MAG: hypothetical protein CVU65_12815 [Deltaproteobacteria bacterium HGW-Deltaproteobacteria-22]
MYHRSDWILRQIEDAIALAIQFAFKSGAPVEEVVEQVFDAQTGDLLDTLREMLKKAEFSDAEDLVFEHLRPGNLPALALALWFYDQLKNLTEDELARGDFSREEITQGLTDVLTMYGIPQ